MIPTDLVGSEFMILYWDPTLNNGLGGWVAYEPVLLIWDATLNGGLGGWMNAPSDYFSAIPNPENITQRLVISVNFTGLFVLVVNE